MYTQMYTFSYSHVFAILICIRPTHAFKNDIYNWKAIYFNDSKLHAVSILVLFYMLILFEYKTSILYATYQSSLIIIACHHHSLHQNRSTCSSAHNCSWAHAHNCSWAHAHKTTVLLSNRAFLHKNNKKKTGIIEKQFILMTRWIFL
jgi:hypothetical protein